MDDCLSDYSCCFDDGLYDCRGEFIMKILNLYAGIGGNRKLWGDEHEITAVEMNTNIANVYRNLFPNDLVFIGDANEFLLDNYKKYDFIWTSPPCQSHSSMRQNLAVRLRGTPAVYPDMSLYQQIIFLQYNFKGKYVVENVKPYYTPLIPPSAVLDRHLFWSNVHLPDKKFERPALRNAQIHDLEMALGYDLDGYKLPDKRQVLRNCVLPDLGKYIMECVTNEI